MSSLRTTGYDFISDKSPLDALRGMPTSKFGLAHYDKTILRDDYISHNPGAKPFTGDPVVTNPRIGDVYSVHVDDFARKGRETSGVRPMVLGGFYTDGAGRVVALDFFSFTTRGVDNPFASRDLSFNAGNLTLKGYKDRDSLLKTDTLITVPNTPEFMGDGEVIGSLNKGRQIELLAKRGFSIRHECSDWKNYMIFDGDTLFRHAYPLNLPKGMGDTVNHPCPDTVRNCREFITVHLPNDTLKPEDIAQASNRARNMFNQVNMHMAIAGELDAMFRTSAPGPRGSALN